ncbi:MAG: DUF423 domain-containing protein [Isosphaeraceae bacterium]
MAAHGLKERLESLGTAATFQTGVEYHFYHVAALLAVGLLSLHLNGPRTSLNVAGWAFLVGILVFSGSLYILGVTGIRWLGAITPLGGVAFLVGWVALALAAAAPEPKPAAAVPPAGTSRVDDSGLLETIADLSVTTAAGAGATSRP